jgi:hypothetical protein
VTRKQSDHWTLICDECVALFAYVIEEQFVGERLEKARALATKSRRSFERSSAASAGAPVASECQRYGSQVSAA